MAFRWPTWLGAASALLCAAALAVPPEQRHGPAAKEPIHPLPSRAEVMARLDPRAVALGKRLFHEARLSADGTLSCASCHPIDRGGADGMVRSLGVGGALGTINAPTVFNSGFNAFQFWDGRAESLEEQALGPITNPVEMAGSWPEILAMLEGEAGYRAAFLALYPDGVTRHNVARAIADFQRSLVTPDGRFDRYLRGEEEALTAEEREGYRLFKDYGCTACHQGRLAGGNMFEKMGVIVDYFTERGNVTEADYGRFNVTGVEEHRFEFKVPGLRNVALTAPYFHDGSALTLEHAVNTMAYYQLGRRLAAEETARIVAFLKTLTGEPPR